MTAAAGDRADAVVVAAAAPLWAGSEDARRIAAFGEPSYPAYRRWARRLLPDQAPLWGHLHTVALGGERVRVLGAAGPSLLEVELLDQPNGDGGYVGVMHAAHVGADARRARTHVVAARGVLAATARPGGARVELPAGTIVELRSDPAGPDPAEVRLASGATVRCPGSALRPLGSPVGATEVLAIAARFVGVPYLWSGVEAAGIDCSGLVHLAARIGGRVVPRDAHHQWAATRIDADADAAAGDLAVGDLLFFGDAASLDGIDHVGIYGGGGRMLHAPEAGRSVVLEPIGDRARARTVGVGRWPS